MDTTLKIEIDWQRFNKDPDYFDDITARYRFETIEAALEADARKHSAYSVVTDILADRLDRIAEGYEEIGAKLEAATTDSHARQGHALAKKIHERENREHKTK